MPSWWKRNSRLQPSSSNKYALSSINSPNFLNVMFGGLHNKPRIELAESVLIAITPDDLQPYYFQTPGIRSVGKFALKMATNTGTLKANQYKHAFVSPKSGYQMADTFAAMSVCDPENGMHNVILMPHSPNSFSFSNAPPTGISMKPVKTAS